MPSLVRKESFDSVTVYWLRREAAVEAVRAAAQRLIEACPEVHSVVLFGSLAQGRAVPGSDADVLIITSDARPWLERNLRYRTYFDLEIGVDIFAYTPDEVERAPVAQRALESGKVLVQRQ